SVYISVPDLAKARASYAPLGWDDRGRSQVPFPNAAGWQFRLTTGSIFLVDDKGRKTGVMGVSVRLPHLADFLKNVRTNTAQFRRLP
ncbi:hypothetical protein, partial [Salmonella enterica]|uniref:hypothetical protein n=1 Tax=Salmonella enterica TaxID=28901 RepID=UPI003CEF7030